MRAGTDIFVCEYTVAQILQFGQRRGASGLDGGLACYGMNEVVQTIRHGGAAVHQLFGQLADNALHVAAVQICRNAAHSEAVFAEWVDCEARLTDLLDLRLNGSGFLPCQLNDDGRQ